MTIGCRYGSLPELAWLESIIILLLVCLLPAHFQLVQQQFHHSLAYHYHRVGLRARKGLPLDLMIETLPSADKPREAMTFFYRLWH